jgi:hypothetical protein
MTILMLLSIKPVGGSLPAIAALTAFLQKQGSNIIVVELDQLSGNIESGPLRANKGET